VIAALENSGVEIDSGAETAGAMSTVSSGFFAQKKVVLTGTLESMTRSEAKKRLEALGAVVTSTISSKTDFLVAGESPGSKLEKAAVLGVMILDEKEFIHRLKR